MTSTANHNQHCKSCAAARNGAPVPYDDLDPEMVDVVKAINTIPGIRTLDSCFGHAGSGDPNKSHQDYAYVGMAITNHDKFMHFWNTFFDVAYGKLIPKGSPGYVQFSVVVYPFDPDSQKLIRLMVDVEHDPAIDPRGAQEKKSAFTMLQSFITEYLALHQDSTNSH